MNLSEVRTTIRDRVISLGYEEITNRGFNTDNIPETVLDKSFHVSVTGGTARAISMHDLVIDNDLEIVLWRRGFREAVEAQDAALLAACEVISSLTEVAFRTSPAYRLVKLENYTLEPIALDNDNTVKLTMNFTVQVSMAVTSDVT